MPTIIYGKIIVSEADDSANLSGYLLQLSINNNIHEAEINEGQFRIRMPSWDYISHPILCRVVEPSGEGIYKKSFTTEELKSELKELASQAEDTIASWEIKLEIDLTPPVTSGSNTSAEDKTMKVRGQLVIANSTSISVAKRKIIIWGKFHQEDETFALASAVTDSAGWFTFARPKSGLIKSYAEIYLSRQYNNSIQLDENGLIPEKILLVVKADSAEATPSTGCCETSTPRLPDAEDLVVSDGTYSEDIGGSCVNFTVPNRTLEEYSFYSVVRTTQPRLKGNSVDDIEITPVPEDLKERLRKIPGLKDYFRSASNDKQDFDELVGGASLELLTDLSKSRGRMSITTAAKRDTFRRLKYNVDSLKASRPPKSNRFSLSASQTIKWDEEATPYQAISISHGHLLEFKQIWKADGYSLGDLLYSLPLAPCQKKRIAIFDWTRSESASRSEFRSFDESLNAALEHDRDISEIINASVSEQMQGSSSSTTKSAGMGSGVAASGAYGPFMLGATGGHSGGIGNSSSKAWQDSSRQTVASSLYELQDRIFQSANAVKNQRSTVVQAVGQNEQVNVQTDIVANHNHCHAITMEYFEVLRHFVLEQKLVNVRECLFIPLLMSVFDQPKALRWKTILSRYLLERRLAKGFDALERIANQYIGSNLPVGKYANESINWISGEVKLRFELATPAIEEDGSGPVLSAWNPLKLLLPSLDPVSFFNEFLRDAQNAAKIFQRELGEKIARKFAQRIRIFAVKDGQNTPQDLNLEVNLISRYREDTPLTATVRIAGNVPDIRRSDIRAIKLAIAGNLLGNNLLPTNSRVIVESLQLDYATPHLETTLCNATSVHNDLARHDDVIIPTPLNKEELKNPRKEDRQSSEQLLNHLNEYLERYHRIIWMNMDREHRYMLLDGVVAPNANGRSVASVVENRLIGIVGNSLVLPVAPGIHLDPTYTQAEDNPVDLYEHYRPDTPYPPYRISLPTRGVYAESVMGACNSCEKIDETRHWRFNEVPCGDEPGEIEPVSTASRRADVGDLSPADFAPSSINIQNAPAVPDPQGLSTALQLLSNPGLFANVTGLDQNQKNTLAALQKAFDSAQQYSQTAASLVPGGMAREIQQTSSAIDSANLSDEEKSAAKKQAIDSIIGNKPNTPALSDRSSTQQLADRVLQSEGAELEISEAGGNSIRVRSGQSASESPTATDAQTYTCRYESEQEIEDSFDHPYQLNIIETHRNQAPEGEQDGLNWERRSYTLSNYGVARGYVESNKLQDAALQNSLQTMLHRLKNDQVIYSLETGKYWAVFFNVYGYSDCTGTESTNMALRSERAESFVTVVVNAINQRPADDQSWGKVSVHNRFIKITAAPFNEYLDSNDTAQGRANNRAVKIVEVWRALDPDTEVPDELLRDPVSQDKKYGIGESVLRENEELIKNNIDSHDSYQGIRNSAKCMLDKILDPGANTAFMDEGSIRSYINDKAYTQGNRISPIAYSSDARRQILLEAFTLHNSPEELGEALISLVKRLNRGTSFAATKAALTEGSEEAMEPGIIMHWITQQQQDPNSIYSCHLGDVIGFN